MSYIVTGCLLGHIGKGRRYSYYEANTNTPRLMLCAYKINWSNESVVGRCLHASQQVGHRLDTFASSVNIPHFCLNSLISNVTHNFRCIARSSEDMVVTTREKIVRPLQEVSPLIALQQCLSCIYIFYVSSIEFSASKTTQLRLACAGFIQLENTM